MRKSKKYYRWLLGLGFLFLLLNVIAFNHAYKFTHFTTAPVVKTPGAEQITLGQKLEALFLGVNNPRPANTIRPNQPYKTVRLQSNTGIECWLLPRAPAKGTVILFHGYGGNKSLMLDKSTEFQKLGYATFLVDFMGSGGSEGVQTTIGFHEAEQVKTSFEFIQKQQPGKVYLFGTSMGAVAILKAIADFNLQPAGIIIECPFGSMYETTSARFKMLGLPAFPMAGLLVFWGGVQNNFRAFGHNPTEYAKKVPVPTLLLYGEQDPKVSRSEINEIYHNLRGKKYISTYARAGHENYLTNYRNEWTADVTRFLAKQ